MKFAVEELKAKLPADEKWKDGVWDVEAFKKGNVSLIFFAPKDVDYQTFHKADEFYRSRNGRAGNRNRTLRRGGRRFVFRAGKSRASV